MPLEGDGALPTSTLREHAVSAAANNTMESIRIDSLLCAGRVTYLSRARYVLSRQNRETHTFAATRAKLNCRRRAHARYSLRRSLDASALHRDRAALPVSARHVLDS
jgi:hypothetical protein